MTKPFSQSCVDNQAVILNTIKPLISDKKNILEIGSGTGQHAVYFAKNISHLIWRTSDRIQYHDGINQWIDESGLTNITAPIELDVSNSTWPNINLDVVYTANTCHIMHWSDVEALFYHVGKLLKPNGLIIIYGPFNYRGQFTSASNKNFDLWLKSKDHQSGIRDFEKLDQLAIDAGMLLKHDIEMPVNNRIFCWQKI